MVIMAIDCKPNEHVDDFRYFQFIVLDIDRKTKSGIMRICRDTVKKFKEKFPDVEPTFELWKTSDDCYHIIIRNVNIEQSDVLDYMRSTQCDPCYIEFFKKRRVFYRRVTRKEVEPAEGDEDDGAPLLIDKYTPGCGYFRFSD